MNQGSAHHWVGGFDLHSKASFVALSPFYFIWSAVFFLSPISPALSRILPLSFP